MDTLRADRLGAYGYARDTSPNIDRLAARAVVFENAISQSSWTRPSHTSMFTGLFPSEHGVISMNGGKKFPSSVPTLAGTLAEAGYATAAFTGGAHMSPYFGFDRGFDIYKSHGRRFEDNLPAARKWVASVGDRPFFLFLHGFDSHKPYKSSPADREALGLAQEPRHGIASVCSHGGTAAEIAPYLGEYDAAVHHGDRAIGAFLDMLAELGHGDDTVVVFVSDHGEEFLEHGRCFHIRTLYREVLHVPLIVAVPKQRPRRVSEVVAASASIAPTVAEIVGLPPAKLPGPSLAAAVAGRRFSAPPVLSETATRFPGPRSLGHLRAYTDEGEKLIDWISLGRQEYFDLARDPGEQHPLLESAAGRRLAAGLERWMDEHPGIHNKERLAELPKGLARQLHALGYMR